MEDIKYINDIYRYMTQEEFDILISGEKVLENKKDSLFFFLEKNPFYSTVADKDFIYNPLECKVFFQDRKDLILVRFKLKDHNKIKRKHLLFADPYDKVNLSKVAIEVLVCSSYDKEYLIPLRCKKSRGTWKEIN